MININKDLFPLLKQKKDLIYLDSAATSLKPQIVLDKINDYYSTIGANINRGVYDLSNEASTQYELSRKRVAEFIGARNEEIVFTKGCTESLNMIASWMENYVNLDDEIIVSVLDHHSFIIPFQELAKKTKAKLKYVPLDNNYLITEDNLKSVITDKTKILCLTYVSNVLGNIQKVKELAKIAHEHNLIVIVDAAQALPHFKIDVKDLDVDFLAFSMHKMLGPTGVGVLYGKYHLLNKMPPLTFGGDMNDGVDLYDSTYKDAPNRFEAGTPNISGVIAAGEAINYLKEIGMDEVYQHSNALSQYVIENIKDIKNVVIYNPHTIDSVGLVTFNILGIHPHDTATFLATKGICVRAGHHCAQLITKYLNVIGTVRASFYIYNTMEDADKLIEAIKEASKYFEDWM